MKANAAAVERYLISPEKRLLLDCLRSSLYPEGGPATSVSIPEGIDWSLMLRLAYRHAVIPPFCRELRRAAPGSVPEDRLIEADEAFKRNAGQSLFLAGELVSLLRLLESEGIRALPLKGPVLALSVYGSVAMRQFCDLDLLVDRGDFKAARRLLLRFGYRSEQNDGPPEESCTLFDSGATFISPAGAEVELHWQPVPREFAFPLSVGDLLERCRSLSLGGLTVPDLAFFDSLILAAVHGTRHLWDRLGWLYDTARLADRCRDADWQVLLDAAAGLGCRRALLLSLLLGGLLFDADLPGTMQEAVTGDRDVVVMAGDILDRLLQERNGPPTVREIRRFQRRSRDDWRSRAVYSWRLAVLPGMDDWQWLHLPASFVWVYPFIRPFRLLAKHGLSGAGETT